MKHSCKILQENLAIIGEVWFKLFHSVLEKKGVAKNIPGLLPLRRRHSWSGLALFSENWNIFLHLGIFSSLACFFCRVCKKIFQTIMEYFFARFTFFEANLLNKATFLTNIAITLPFYCVQSPKKFITVP